MLAPDRQDEIFLHGKKFVEFWENYFTNHKWGDNEGINIYIDFPYCVSNCKYCMLQPSNMHTHRHELPIYEEKVLELMDQMKHLFHLRPVESVVFGGGTPSLMPRRMIKKIMDLIPMWDDAPFRKMEIHPRDLTDDYVDFLIKEVRLTNVSFGIQSFNVESNRDQHRITCNIHTLVDSVKKLQDNGVRVNIDLVALFNGEQEKDWEIFKDDLKIIRDIVKPDLFFTQVNYATESRYYEHSLRLRKELKAFINTTDQYIFGEETYNSLDINDVQRFLDTTYFLIKPKYHEHLTINELYQDPRLENCIGFGGNINHQVFSLTKEGNTIYSYYDFNSNRFIHRLIKTEIPAVSSDHFPSVTISSDDPIPTIQVGRYTIPPYTKPTSTSS